MVMPVQQKVRTVGGDYALEDRRIQQSLVTSSVAVGRMMDQYDPKEVLNLELVEYGRELGELFCAEPAGGKKRCRRHTG